MELLQQLEANTIIKIIILLDGTIYQSYGNKTNGTIVHSLIHGKKYQL